MNQFTAAVTTGTPATSPSHRNRWAATVPGSIGPIGESIGAVATAMGVNLRGGRVIAEGHWDARGTLGVDRDVPVGLTDIALRFELDTHADAATVQRLVEMSERFCVIYQSLRTPPRLSVTHQIVAGA